MLYVYLFGSVKENELIKIHGVSSFKIQRNPVDISSIASHILWYQLILAVNYNNVLFGYKNTRLWQHEIFSSPLNDVITEYNFICNGFLYMKLWHFFESVFVNSQRNFSDIVLMELNVKIGIADRWTYMGC
jgi:hypothetical protein